MAYYLSILAYLYLVFRSFTYYTLVKLKNKELPSLILHNLLKRLLFLVYLLFLLYKASLSLLFFFIKSLLFIYIF
jgi:hypothetical protein